MIAEALHDLLLATSGVTDLLADFQFTTGDDSFAVFTNRTPPETSEYPCIIIDEIGGPPAGTRGKMGADCFARIRVYTNNLESLDELRHLSWLVWKTVNRSLLGDYLDGDGFENILTVADAPAALEDKNGFPGYLIGVRVEVIET